MRYFFDNDEEWAKFKSELLSWIGTPYRHLWGAKGRGTDCNQFVGNALTQAGILDGYKFDIYSPEWYIHLDKEIIYDYIMYNKRFLKSGLDFIELEPDNLYRGDYLLFAYHSPKGLMNHVGVYLDNNEFIHSAPERGVIVSELNYHWKKHLKKVLRLVEL
jgi:cell wall-associated NlpC family hydrolase